MNTTDEAVFLLKEITEFETNQMAQRQNKELLESNKKEYQEELEVLKENLKTCIVATELLNKVSTKSVEMSYKFIEDNINQALRRIFPDKVRIITLEEYTLRGYPQLQLSLTVENGVKRSLKKGSGHGIGQTVSNLCLLCLIVICGARRLVVFDEVMSGMDEETRRAFEGIMQDFASIGFQFICVEHGFAPPVGSFVIRLGKVEDKPGIQVAKSFVQTGKTAKQYLHEVGERTAEADLDYAE